MPDNAPEVPPVPPSSAKPGPSPVPVAKKKPEPLDPAHVPMTEEFDRAKWTLPPAGIVLIGLAIAAIVGGILMFIYRAKPVAAGGINTITSVAMSDNTVMTAVQLDVSNATPKRWYIQAISAKVKTEQGEWSDEAAPAVDSQRYFQAFPALGEAGTQVLKFDQKLAPGEHETGTVVFSFPITKEQFDQRKSLTITITPYDNAPVTFTK